MTKKLPSDIKKNLPKKDQSTNATNHNLPLFGDTNHDGKISPAEDDALNVNLNINPNQINAVITQASQLRASGVDQLNVNSKSISLDVSQATSLLGQDQHFSPRGDLYFSATTDVTLTVTQSQEEAVLNLLPSLRGLGIDHLNWTSHQVTDQQASEIVEAGLDFSLNSGGIDLVISQAAGTQLSTTLSELQKLGVDDVELSGAALNIGSLSVSLGDSLSNVPLPLFGDTNHDGKISQTEDNALNVNLKLDANQLGTVITHDTQLRSMGVDQLNINGGKITLDVAQAQQMLGANQKFSKQDDLYFSAATDVTLTVMPADIKTLVSQATDFRQLGIDYIDLPSGVISDTTAKALVEAGLSFSTDVTVDIGQAEGTQLSTSLTELQELGVNSVLLSGEAATVASLSIDLGDHFASNALTEHQASFDQHAFIPTAVEINLSQIYNLTELDSHVTHLLQISTAPTISEGINLEKTPFTTFLTNLDQFKQELISESKDISTITNPRVVAELKKIIADSDQQNSHHSLSEQDLQKLENIPTDNQANILANIPDDPSKLEIIKDHDIPPSNAGPTAPVEPRLIGQQQPEEEWMDKWEG